MKGMLYSSLMHNRKFIIGSLICFGASTALVLIGSFFFREYLVIALVLSMLSKILPVVTLFIALEGLDREFESSIKNRFANYTLAAVTPGKFTAMELIKNLIMTVYGTGLALLMAFIFRLADNALVPDDRIYILLVLMGVLAGIVQWVIMPLVIRFRSAEKAGMAAGLVVGFGIVLPVMLFTENYAVDFSIFLEYAGAWKLIAGFFAVAVLIYLLFYLLLLGRLKRGNIC